jgi:hypothetical protein
VTSPTPEQLELLHRLASLYEVSRWGNDADGKAYTRTPEELLELLRGEGVRVDGFDGLDEALQKRLLRDWHRRIVTYGPATRYATWLRLPASDLAAGYECLLREESGVEHRWRQVRTWQETSTGPVIGGVEYFAVPLSLPGSLPVGSHQIEVVVGDDTLTGTIEILPPEPQQVKEEPA